MYKLEELTYRRAIFDFCNKHIDKIISYFENSHTHPSPIPFYFFYIKPHVVKLGLPPYTTFCFLRRFEDLIYKLKDRGCSNHLYRICKCNDYNYVKSEYQDCCHEQLRIAFLTSIKDIFTNFILFNKLCNEKIPNSQFFERRIHFTYPEKSTWEMLFD